MDALRAKLRQTFAAAVSDGRLTESLAESKEAAVSGDTLRDKMKQALRDAADDGRLEKAFQSVQQDSWNDTRSAIRQTLTAAAADGRLEAAMNDVRKTSAPSSDARAQVQQVIAEAASNGRLEEALAGGQNAASVVSINALRSRLKATFAQATADGSLAVTLSGIQSRLASENTSDALRLKLQQTFSKASFDDELESDMLDLKAQARAVLCDGLQSGALRAALFEVHKEQASLEELRQRAGAALAKAAESGVLSEVLTETIKPQSKPAAATGFSALKAKLQSMFFRASKDGSFGAALKQVKPPAPSPSEALALKLRKTFNDAASSGQLTNALQEVTAPQESLPKASEAMPAKPTVAKGTTRPRPARVSAAKPPTPVSMSPVPAKFDYTPPMSASKRNRRVIGGVARVPAAEAPPPLDPFPLSPSRRSMVPAFRMDVYGASSASGDSKSPKGYDMIPHEDDALGCAASQWSIPLAHGISHLRVQPGSKLHFSQSTQQPSSKFRSNSVHNMETSHNSGMPKSHMSAMALDLDDEEWEEEEKPVKLASAARSKSVDQASVTKLPPVYMNSSTGIPSWSAKLPPTQKRNAIASAIAFRPETSAQQWDVSRCVL
jgi:hypothetical protein